MSKVILKHDILFSGRHESPPLVGLQGIISWLELIGYWVQLSSGTTQLGPLMSPVSLSENHEQWLGNCSLGFSEPFCWISNQIHSVSSARCGGLKRRTSIPSPCELKGVCKQHASASRDPLVTYSQEPLGFLHFPSGMVSADQPA